MRSMSSGAVPWVEADGPRDESDFFAFTRSMRQIDRHLTSRHLMACEAERSPTHARLWRRLAVSLFRLAPLRPEWANRNGMRFFVPDGDYRRQLFALEDRFDGRVHVYLPDVLQPNAEELVALTPGSWVISSRQNTPKPAAHVEHMLTWNRRALRVTVSALEPSATCVAAVERACAAAAGPRWRQLDAGVGMAAAAALSAATGASA